MAIPGPERLRRWLLCGCWLSAWALYTVCAAFSEFFGRVFISQYRFTFPAFIALCQALLTMVTLQLLKRAGLLKIKPYLLESGEIFLLPSICFSFHSILILWAVTSSNCTVFTFIRRFTPLASLALVQTFNLKKRASSSRALLVLLVTLCSVLAGIPSFNDETIVYVYGLLNLVLESTYLTLLQKICEDQNISVMDVYYTCTINSCPLLFVYCLLHPDTHQIYPSGSWTSLIFLGFFSLVLLLGCLLKFLICMCTLLSSALMTSMMELAKTDVLTLRSIIACEWIFSSHLTSLLISASGVGIFIYKDCRETNISTRKEAMGIQI
ncbi:solute carrier family 35 member D3-like isoform X2 [Pristis pectinata]|uniref:solute carrier family 35 member D3-like isoform X2 n=1 Tax=Pristis pectinata TaxID=685728 RepID=UPI00223E889E|nr:solute carrier family 35 member D3-like isoform X2 [Pristis pectinata]